MGRGDEVLAGDKIFLFIANCFHIAKAQVIYAIKFNEYREKYWKLTGSAILIMSL